ncbi:hypothetical protein [uncultured Paracoccus sp.]|uniref:hypothetical protein n=1 Tax=uncultured Paracoccus sp. TaxID=189685 RepID=UPI00260AB4FC|nr:hypothetical protein [uncultured Paracoccus sp.]
MTEFTHLDRLCTVPFHEAEDTLRAEVLRRLADTELFAALAADPKGDRVELMLFDLGGLTAALASEDAAELARLVGGPVAHAAMPGRVLAATLAAEGRGLLVNPDRPSQMLLDPQTLSWLGQALAQRPAEIAARPTRLGPPDPDAVQQVAEPLARLLADRGGVLTGAALVAADWGDGTSGHLLAIAGAADEDRAALAKAVAELLAFLPPVPGGLDVAFEPVALPSGALRLELSAVEPVTHAADATSSQDAPPRLRW